jgi:hypothetical protein
VANTRLREEVEEQTRELIEIKREQMEFQQRLKQMIGSRTL